MDGMLQARIFDIIAKNMAVNMFINEHGSEATMEFVEVMIEKMQKEFTSRMQSDAQKFEEDPMFRMLRGDPKEAVNEASQMHKKAFEDIRATFRDIADKHQDEF